MQWSPTSERLKKIEYPSSQQIGGQCTDLLPRIVSRSYPDVEKVALHWSPPYPNGKQHIQGKNCVLTRFFTVTPFFLDSNPSRLLINRLKYFQIRFYFAEIFNHKVRKNRLRGVHDTAESKFQAQQIKMFFFNSNDTVDVVTPKRISPDCPFESNQRLTKITILTPRCAV